MTNYSQKRCVRKQTVLLAQDLMYGFGYKKVAIPKRLRSAVRAYAAKVARAACGKSKLNRGWV